MTNISNLIDIDAVRIYLNRIGAEPRSLRTAVVKEQRGTYWKDIVVIRFNKDGAVSCFPDTHRPTALEAEAITDAFSRVNFPKTKLVPRIINPPRMIADADPENIFEFWDESGKNILFVQVRVSKGPGEKSYVPWTYWSDDKWRCAEPDAEDGLPLWGLDQLKDYKTAFIHEGAKAAAACRRLNEARFGDELKRKKTHPWGEALSGVAHLGWVGGALNPERTNFSPLAAAGVERVIIVADNDPEGKSAIPNIARQFSIPTFSVEFSQRFPGSFDLADEFPESMFEKINGARFYTGPSMRALMQPVTWATDEVPNPNGRGRPSYRLRSSFSKVWAYADEPDSFVCMDMPEIRRPRAIFNNLVSPFSHVDDTARLLLRNYKGRTVTFCYRPDIDKRVIESRSGAISINLYRPSNIRSLPGDPEPWLEFLRYMFPRESERKTIERWCATLIARPEIRMLYGLLIVSETQGTGKTTLGSTILKPLVGLHNSTEPSESDIMRDFNGWVDGKRFAVVNEIYCGHSWKAYRRLKPIVTDTTIRVNQKNEKEYELENWVHMFACSNSPNALKIENKDRRWFYPKVTEVAWTPTQFGKFREWLNGGGLSIIKHWAETYGDYVGPGEWAPMSKMKKELIENSRSEAQKAVSELANALVEMEKPCALFMNPVIAWARIQVGGTVWEPSNELRATMAEEGAIVSERPMKQARARQYAVMNKALHFKIREELDTLSKELVERKAPDEARDRELKARYCALIREFSLKPLEIIETEL